MWMPLDKKIQTHIWDNTELELNSIDFYIYKLVYAFFFDRAFTSKTISYLEKMESVLQDDMFKELLQMVFFKYSSHLIEKLSRKEYYDLIEDYFSFLDY